VFLAVLQFKMNVKVIKLKNF